MTAIRQVLVIAPDTGERPSTVTVKQPPDAADSPDIHLCTWRWWPPVVTSLVNSIVNGFPGSNPLPDKRTVLVEIGSTLIDLSAGSGAQVAGVGMTGVASTIDVLSWGIDCASRLPHALIPLISSRINKSRAKISVNFTDPLSSRISPFRQAASVLGHPPSLTPSTSGQRFDASSSARSSAFSCERWLDIRLER